MQQFEVNTSSSAPLVSRIPEGAAVALRIIDTFAEKTQEAGIRSVVMGELAKEMRISKKTLYKYFSSKEDLVYELVVRWENRLYQPLYFDESNVVDALRGWVDRWVKSDAQFSPAFWLDLRSDYPKLYALYTHSLFSRIDAMRSFIRPYLRDDAEPEFVWAVYRTLMTNAAQPKMFKHLGLTREQCVSRALDFWIEAAMDLEKIQKTK